MTLEETIQVLQDELQVVEDMITYHRDFEGQDTKVLEHRVKRKEAIAHAVSALKELQQYREIGAAKECSKASGKQMPMVPIRTKDGHLACKCGMVIQFRNVRKALYFCTNCGRCIDWDSELLEWDSICAQNINNTATYKDLKGMEDDTPP